MKASFHGYVACLVTGLGCGPDSRHVPDGAPVEPDATAVAVDAPMVCGDLVAHYRFDEATGPVLDASGCSNHGIAYGAQRIAHPGSAGLSATFGTHDYIEVPPSPSLTALAAGSALTIEAVVQVELAGATVLPHSIVSLGNGAGGDAFAFHLGSDTPLGVTAGTITCSGMTTFNDRSSARLVAGWNHVAARFDIATGTLSFFINGTPTDTATYTSYASTSFCPTQDSMFIGAVNASGAWTWHGAIDELKLYKRLLTDEQICSDAGGQLVGGACVPRET